MGRKKIPATPQLKPEVAPIRMHSSGDRPDGLSGPVLRAANASPALIAQISIEEATQSATCHLGK